MESQMKKIVSYLLLAGLIFLTAVASFAQQTDASLTTQSNVIRDETTAGGNSKTRIAAMFQSLIDSKINRAEAYTASGTNSYAITVNATVTSYTTGLIVPVIFTNANTGAATINLTPSGSSALGAKSIKKNVSSALVSGDIPAGSALWLIYDGTNFQVNIGSGTVGVANGGTGVTSYTSGDILYASGTTTLSKLAATTDGFHLVLSGGLPAWASNAATTIWGQITGSITDQGDLASTYTNQTLTTNPQTTDYTFQLTDFNGSTVVELSGSTGRNFTVPPNATVAVPTGKFVYARYTGAGTITFVQGSGVTITSTKGTLGSSDVTGEFMLLYKTGTNTWFLNNGKASSGAWGTITGTLSAQTDLQSALDAKLSNSRGLLTYAALGSTIKAQAVDQQAGNISGNTVLTNQVVQFVALEYLPTAQTLTGLKFYQSTAGSYTANNNNRVGLYSYSGGTLTLVASSANDGNLWQTASSNAHFSVAFSSTYAAAAGQYFVGFIYCRSAAATAPTLGINAANPNGATSRVDFTNSARLYSSLAAQTDIPSSVAMSSLAAETTRFWVAVY